MDGAGDWDRRTAEFEQEQGRHASRRGQHGQHRVHADLALPPGNLSAGGDNAGPEYRVHSGGHGRRVTSPHFSLCRVSLWRQNLTRIQCACRARCSGRASEVWGPAPCGRGSGRGHAGAHPFWENFMAVWMG